MTLPLSGNEECHKVDERIMALNPLDSSCVTVVSLSIYIFSLGGKHRLVL